MCLDRITKDIIDESEKSGIGWKVYSTLNGKLWRWAYKLPPGQTLERNVWLRADTSRNIEINVFLNWGVVTYKSGFHIYLRDNPPVLEDEGEVLVKVNYRGARILGEQEGIPVIVADEIMILEDD